MSVYIYSTHWVRLIQRVIATTFFFSIAGADMGFTLDVGQSEVTTSFTEEKSIRGKQPESLSLEG